MADRTNERRLRVTELLEELKSETQIVHAIKREFGASRAQVLGDLKWARQSLVSMAVFDIDAEPERLYRHVDGIAAYSWEMGVRNSDPNMLRISLKARTAQLAMLGYRDKHQASVQLQKQQVRMTKAKASLAEQQAKVAREALKAQRERQELKTGGGAMMLQEPDQQVFNRMARYILTGSAELEGWIEARIVEGGSGDKDSSEDLGVGGGDAGSVGGSDAVGDVEHGE